MVMLPTTAKGRVFKFHSMAEPENTLLVGALEGVESISRPYRFELLLLSPKVDVDTGKLLAAPAFLEVKRASRVGSKELLIFRIRRCGMLAEFEQCEKGPLWVVYRAVFVPRLWKLSLNVQTRIFMNQTVPEIVSDVLRKAGFEEEGARSGGQKGPPQLSSEEPQDDLRVDRPAFLFAVDSERYPKREYVVQYQESDLDFISRLLEHEGIGYYFESADPSRETTVFTDSMRSFPPIDSSGVLPYRPHRTASQSLAGLGTLFPEESVAAVTCRHKVIQNQVVLADYNWRAPGTMMKSEAAVVPSGSGTFYEYGDHFKDKSEGDRLARVRAEEIRCRERLFVGKSDCRSAQAGFTYTLEEHYRPDFNAQYLFTEVRHRAEQVIPQPDGKVASLAYHNEFVTIPTKDGGGNSNVFRPQRLTPKPKIPGTLNAVVDAAGSGQYAEINEGGSYRIKTPFDLSDKDKGQASRAIRMAQPYAGAEMGMHFPLHKGTEVILTHVNGDPDRPIIAAAIPNPQTGSPVTGGNSTQCVIQTGGGNAIAMEDTDGAQYICMGSPSASTHFSLGADHHSPPQMEIGVPQGIVAGTEEGVFIHGGSSVVITAGASTHAESAAEAMSRGEAMNDLASTVASIAGIAGGTGMDFVTARAHAWPTITTALGAVVGSKTIHKAVAITSKAEASLVGGTEVVIAAGGTATLLSAGPAMVFSAQSAGTVAVWNAAVLAGKNVEIVGNFGDVRVEAKYRGDVKVEGFKNVLLEAKNLDVKIEAGCDVEVKAENAVRVEAGEGNLILKTEKGEAKLEAHKLLEIESKQVKRIHLHAGRSSVKFTDALVETKAEGILADAKKNIGLGAELMVFNAKEAKIGWKEALMKGSKMQMNYSKVNIAAGTLTIKE